MSNFVITTKVIRHDLAPYKISSEPPRRNVILECGHELNTTKHIAETRFEVGRTVVCNSCTQRFLTSLGLEDQPETLDPSEVLSAPRNFKPRTTNENTRCTKCGRRHIHVYSCPVGKSSYKTHSEWAERERYFSALMRGEIDPQIRTPEDEKRYQLHKRQRERLERTREESTKTSEQRQQDAERIVSLFNPNTKRPW